MTEIAKPPTVENVSEVISPDAAYTGAAKVINLDHERFKLSRRITPWILTLFGISTIAVFGLVVWLASIDVRMIEQKLITPADRLITANVIMAVIGATFVQLGAATVLIVQSVFRARSLEPPINTDEF